MNDMNRRKLLCRMVIGLNAGALIGLNAEAFARQSASPGPNIVYVLTDQWRAQATGYAGDPNAKTPNLDLLASSSVNFKNAVSVCPVCTPHRAALLTGRYPLSTGMITNDMPLPDEELCMGEIFKQAGYETGYIGKWHLDGNGRGAFIPKERRRGFDYWKVLECTHDYNASKYYAGDDATIRKWDGYDAYAQTKDAQAYIKEQAKKAEPFLLVLSYGPPHFPLNTAPAEFTKQYHIDSIKLRPNVPGSMKSQARKGLKGYYGHCSAVDRCVGDLQKTLKETGILENTIFVFTSDHGSMFGSQGRSIGEKRVPWDESIRVPFLLSYPPLTGSEECIINTPINTPDILPTLLALAGVSIPKTIEGEDLSPLIRDRRSDEDRSALIMAAVRETYRGIRTARYTYVCNDKGTWLMFDNEKDPYQMTNLAGSADHAGLQKELHKKLQAELKKTGDDFLSKGSPKTSRNETGSRANKKRKKRNRTWQM